MRAQARVRLAMTHWRRTWWPLAVLLAVAGV
jgi:hypothetical protein